MFVSMVTEGVATESMMTLGVTTEWMVTVVTPTKWWALIARKKNPVGDRSPPVCLKWQRSIVYDYTLPEYYTKFRKWVQFDLREKVTPRWGTGASVASSSIPRGFPCCLTSGASFPD